MAGYSNDGGGTLGSPNNTVDSGLLQLAASTAVPDYSGVLGKLLADKQTQAKLALASNLQDQIDYEKAQRTAELSALKAKQAEADMHTKMWSDPKYQEALSAEYSQKIAEANRSANAVAAGQYQAEKDAADIGLDPQAYTVNGQVDHGTLATDVQRLRQRNTFLGQGYSPDEAKKATGPTRQESFDTPATDDTAPASEPGSALSDAPSPDASDTAAPAQGSAPLANAPAPGAAPAPATTTSGVTLPAGIAPNAPQTLAAAKNSVRRQVAIANKIPPFAVTDKMLEDAIGITTTKEIFVDPKTQDSYEAQVTKDRAGNVYRTSDPIMHERSKTQQQIDTEAAKDYQDYVQNQGVTRDKNDIATLDSAIKILRDGKTTASGAFLNLLPENVKNMVLSDTGKQVPQMVQSVLLSHLKEAFPGKVSNIEFEKSMDLIFNKSVSEPANANTIERKRNELASALEYKRDSMQYFGAHGTLEGYQPKALQDSPGSSTATSAASAPLGTVRFHPVTGAPFKLIKNEVTGKSDWVPQ